MSRADRVKADWRQWAYSYFKGLVALTTSPFLAEDLIERHYGGIIRMLAKDKVIVKVGYALARTSNCSPKCLWQRAETASEAVIQNKP